MEKLLLSPTEVMDLTGLSRTTLWRYQVGMMDGWFPKARQISDNRVAYIRAEIDAWINSLPEANTESLKEETI